MNSTVTPYKDSNKSKAAQVEEMFDNIAHRYDFLNRILSLGIDISWRKKAIQSLETIHPKSILDLATGTGDFAVEALSLNPTEVIGYDISEGMMKYGREKAVNLGKENILKFIKGDSEQMIFKDNHFDAITVGFGVRNFQNLEKGLSEMHRVLRVGGKIAILEVSRPQNIFIRTIYDLYFRYILPIIGRIFSKDIRAYTYLPESVVAFPQGEEFVSILKKMGFKNAQWQALTFGTCAFYTCEK